MPVRSSRVLVIRAGALGDTLMVTPLIRALRNANPDGEIDLLASVGGAELLASNPYLSRIVTLRSRNVPYLLSFEKRRIVAGLGSRRYATAVVLESAPRFRDLVERAGIHDVRDFATQGFDPGSHSIVSNLRIAGFENPGPAELDMNLPVGAEAIRAAGELLAGLPRPIVGMQAGYGPIGKKSNQANRLRGWDPANFAEVARELIASGASIVLTGSLEDVDVCQSIAGMLPVRRVRVLAGRTRIAVLAGVIKSFDLLISVDSGPAHIAAAVGTPLIVLWGPGILAQTRPVSSTTPITILQSGVACAPCYGTPLMKSCTRNICMEYITPPRVIAAAREVLGWPALYEARYISPARAT